MAKFPLSGRLDIWLQASAFRFSTSYHWFYVRCYYLKGVLQDWWHNRNFCEKQNARLISIDSNEQAEFVVKAVKKLIIDIDKDVIVKSLTPMIFIVIGFSKFLISRSCNIAHTVWAILYRPNLLRLLL